jgi:hypothetical protein
MKTKLWKLFLRALRAGTWALDGWIQRQEEKLREAPARAAALAEVDPVASARREQQIAGVSADGCTSVPVHRDKATGARDRLSAVSMAPRRQKGVVIIRKPKPARLRYRAGQFVREA